MRGRYARPLTIDPQDLSILQAIVRSRSHPWFQVERARLLLGVARVNSELIADCSEHVLDRPQRGMGVIVRPPAAATMSARFAVSWPRTSTKSTSWHANR